MWKWIIKGWIVALFFFYPSTIDVVGAFMWGVLLLRYALNEKIFAAILLFGIYLGYALEPPAMYAPLVKVAFAGALIWGSICVYDFLRPILSGELSAALRDEHRLNQLLRESLGQAQYILAGQSSEIFFNGSEDRFADRIASSYRSVGWGAVVVDAPGLEQIGLTNELSGKKVVVITAPASPEAARNSLMLLAFSLD